jgi:hypothetical protein
MNASSRPIGGHQCLTLSTPLLILSLTQNSTTRASAEATLIAFRDAPGALDAARAVVDSPASLGARFQAALVLRDAGLRRWDDLGPPGQAALRAYLVSALLSSPAASRGGPGDSLVSSQLARALATLTKRAWGGWGAGERGAALSELEAAAVSPTPGAQAAAALAALEALVAEFNPATASAAGLAWEYHDACRADVQGSGALARLYAVASTAAATSAPAAVGEVRAGGPGPGACAAVCEAALALATTILAWDFRPAGVPASSYGGGRPAVDAPTVRPGAGFTSVLLPPGDGPPTSAPPPSAHAWLFQGLAPALAVSADLGAARSRLATASRGLVVALAGLDGPVFGPAHTHRATAHAARILGPLTAWASPPATACARADGPGGGDGGELRDAARAWAALAPVHRAGGLAAAAAAAGLPGLATMADLATACVAAAGGVGDDAVVGDAADAGALLLDAWSDALAPPSAGPAPSSSAPPALPAAAADGAAAVFAALVRASLATAAAGAVESEDEGEAAAAASGAGAAEDALARAASLGRAAPEAAAGLLAGGLDACRAALAAATASGSDPSIPLEQLCWLARQAAAFLADPAEGEAPAPPLALRAACAAAAAAGRPCPIARLSASLLALPALALTNPDVASPRLMEAAAWAAGRWAATHLIPESEKDGTPPLSPAMAAAYGSGPGGDATGSDLANVAGALLLNPPWAGEVDLHAAVAKRLLPALVRRKRPAAAALRWPAWAALAAAFTAGPDGPACGLAEPVMRHLGQALASAANGSPDAATARLYVAQLAAGPAGALARLGGGGASGAPPLSPAEAARPDVARRVAFLAEAFRGVVRGAPPRTAPATFGAWAGAADALLSIQAAGLGGGARRQATLLLKLASTLVDNLVCHLPAPEAARLVAWALATARAHARAHVGEVSAEVSAATDAEREVRALVNLAAALASRDVTDFSASSNGVGGDLDVGGAVFAALETVSPLMTGGMLAFPKLGRAYFALLGHVLETYPHLLPAAPTSLATSLLSALEHGCTVASDEELAKPSLEGLAALARWAARDAAAGGAGGAALSPHLGGRLVRPLLASLLIGGGAASLAAPRSRVDAAADALLPLAMGAPGAWGEARAALLAGAVADPAAAARLEACLAGFEGALTEAAGVLEGGRGRAAPAAERAARRKFRGAANAFVDAARGIVRTR